MSNITLQTTPNGGAFDLVTLYAGDIDICSGTYYSTLSIDAFTDFDITGHGNVVFDGQNANPLLKLDSTSTSGTSAVSIDGITFENGFNDFYVDELSTGSGNFFYTGGALTCNPNNNEIDLTLTNVDFLKPWVVMAAQYLRTIVRYMEPISLFNTMRQPVLEVEFTSSRASLN